MVAADDIVRMREHLFFEGADVRSRLSRFWLLLVLAAVIATATVIGAMIVAPLMTPILGIVLAMVLNDRRNLLRSIAMVVAGACVVVALGYLIGLAIPEPVTAATDSQVASRVSPRLVDLLAALATGAVGSVALIRSDISDTLPGVAIAISLVPPLSVVGLTLRADLTAAARRGHRQRRAGPGEAGGARTRLGEDVHRAGDHQAEHGDRDHRLDGHGDLGPRDQRHDVGRAERSRRGQRQVEVVEELGAPAGRGDLRGELLGECEVGMLARVVRSRRRAAAVHQPVEQRECEHIARPDQDSGGEQLVGRVRLVAAVDELVDQPDG
ncbi:MAG TPA: DUF389 domain-containing protein, partial [Mycobacteriales bacterium]